MRKRTAFVSLCLFLITAVLVYFPLSAAAEQPDAAVVSSEEISERLPVSSEEVFGFDEYGGIFPFCGNQNLRRDAKTTPLQDHLSDFDQFSASFCANQIHLDSSKPNSQRRILYLCEPKDARCLLTSPTNN